MAKHTPVIDIPSRGGVRGRMEKLYDEYFTKATALRITLEILNEDDRHTALAAVPKKLIEAEHRRNGERAAVKTSRPRNGRKRASPITGKHLSLFVLDHLDESESRSLEHLSERITAAGAPPADMRAISGPIGGLVRRRLVKQTRDGFRRLAKGTQYRDTIRGELEAAGQVVPGGYLTPAAATP